MNAIDLATLDPESARLLRAGEMLVVTDHGRVVARVVPASAPNPGPLAAVKGKLLPELAARGLATLPSGRRGKTWTSQGTMTLDEIRAALDETRADRS